MRDHFTGLLSIEIVGTLAVHTGAHRQTVKAMHRTIHAINTSTS